MGIRKKYVLTPKKERFIKENYLKMTDEEMGKILHVPRGTVLKWRTQRLGLTKRGVQSKTSDNEIIKAPVKAVSLKRMSEEERREFFLHQLRQRPRYHLMRQGLSVDELRLYEEKYVEYFSSPDIETLTSHEEDDLHELTMLQITILRLRKEEFESRQSGQTLVDNSKQIKEATELILKFKHSLDIERGQRLKKQEDSATNFTNLIREINERHTRVLAGEEATMLKFRMEEAVNLLVDNDLALGVEPVDLAKNFIDGKLPADYEPPKLEERVDKDAKKAKGEEKS